MSAHFNCTSATNNNNNNSNSNISSSIVNSAQSSTNLPNDLAAGQSVNPSSYYLAMAREYCRTLQAATENVSSTEQLEYCPQQFMTNMMMASMAVAASLIPQQLPFNTQSPFAGNLAPFLNAYASLEQSRETDGFSKNSSEENVQPDNSCCSAEILVDDFHPNTPTSSLADDNDLAERNKEGLDGFKLTNKSDRFSWPNHGDNKSVCSSVRCKTEVVTAVEVPSSNKDHHSGNMFNARLKSLGEEITRKKKRESNTQKSTIPETYARPNSASTRKHSSGCMKEEKSMRNSEQDIKGSRDLVAKNSKSPPNGKDCNLLNESKDCNLFIESKDCGDEEVICCDDEAENYNQWSPNSTYFGSPGHDPALFNKYPIIIVSPQGTISVYLRENCIVEMTVNRTLRVVCQGKFSAASNWQGNTNGILHADGRILQQDTRVQCLFGKNKVASFGPQGVIVNMKPSTTAYIVSSTMFKGTTAIPAECLRLPSMDYDFTMAVFYNQSNNLPQALAYCQEIIRHHAKHFERQDGSLSVNINGVHIRQDKFGNVTVNCRPRTIQISPQKNTISVRTHFVDMAVQEDEKAYVKRGVKRVHVSKSGMVVSDGECITAMDHYGRIVSST